MVIIRDSEWSKKETMSVSVMSSASFLSMGDIMRELDSKALIRSDFILINGAILTTFDLEVFLDEHRKRRESDKNCAVTLLYRKTTPQHHIICNEQAVVVATETSSNRIRFFQRLHKALTSYIPLEIFQENDEITIHYNVLDSYISICSPCVPPLFSDNFDYQDMDDFVKGLIVNEELLGNSMYIHINNEGYGANISNLVMYDSVRQCQLQQNVVIGQGTKIGENVHISNSVIGKNCSIGKNVLITGSYLWDGVSVGDSCNLDTCLLADKVNVGNNVSIKPGCVLGPEVSIDDGIILPTLTRLQAEEVCDDDSFGEEDFEFNKSNKSIDKNLVGANGHGYICNISEEEEDDDDENTKITDVWGRPFDSCKFLEDEDSSSSEILSVDEGASGESEVEGDDYDDDISQFYREVLDSLHRGYDERVQLENMILEINSSKHAYNISIKEVVSVLVKALLNLPFEYDANLTTIAYGNMLKRLRISLDKVIFNYVRSADTQYTCLLAVEDFMKNHGNFAQSGVTVIKAWYDDDVLHELVIFRWFYNISPENANIKRLIDPFMKWLREAEEESSGD
ncbi:translation initiation factor eIF-2B subunit epsilon [Nephila pilipes]|uniref:Translation initiation factor eIF2B subunit epsilon n=1 Tax=Nephila pilipes TaxID=299642 RepID=A0A8X6MNC5_NEPPI|nr:translation initiation factor eIF-2B subunit epsilon [Nephila pilipes]